MTVLFSLCTSGRTTKSSGRTCGAAFVLAARMLMGKFIKAAPTEINIYGSAVRRCGNDAPVSTFCSCRLAHSESSPLLAGVSFSSEWRHLESERWHEGIFCTFCLNSEMLFGNIVFTEKKTKKKTGSINFPVLIAGCSSTLLNALHALRCRNAKNFFSLPKPLWIVCHAAQDPWETLRISPWLFFFPFP